jgi:hypothetical protein
MKDNSMTRGLGGHSPANVMHYLKWIDFPAKKAELQKLASENRAPEEILEVLEDLSENAFNSATDVMKAFGREEREKEAEK